MSHRIAQSTDDGRIDPTRKFGHQLCLVSPLCIIKDANTVVKDSTFGSCASSASQGGDGDQLSAGWKPDALEIGQDVDDETCPTGRESDAEGHDSLHEALHD